jgi:DNA-binding transcriptional MerR regulator
MRVQELAERAGIRVDTVRYYQARGLLDPPRREGRVAWYSASHFERLRQVKDLQAKGLSLGVISRVLSGELDSADTELAGALARSSLPGGAETLMSLEQLAEATGVPVAILEALAREGLLVPHRGLGPAPIGSRSDASREAGLLVGYTPEDVVVARAGLALLEWGLPLPELLALAREHHAAVLQVAKHAVELFDRFVRKGDKVTRAEEQSGALLVKAFEELLPATVTLVSHHFTRVLLDVALEHMEKEGTLGELEAVREAAWR